MTAFLTVAPLIPLAGVALAFGRGVDPVHDLVLAAPRDTFRVFLARAVTVLVAASLVLLVASLLFAGAGAWRFAWLLPALATTSATMALAPGHDVRRVAGTIAALWVVGVLVMRGSTSTAAVFGARTQVAAVLVAVVSTLVLYRRRHEIEATT